MEKGTSVASKSYNSNFTIFSPGQALVLQEVENVDDPVQGVPPYSGPFVVLDWVMVPDPHVVEHEPQGPQLFQVQSTANQWHVSNVLNVQYLTL